MSKNNGSSPAYRIMSLVILIILALLFLFPLYWIITGALKTPAAIGSPTPDWWPKELTLRNFQVLFSKRSAPLFQIGSLKGPTIPGAIRWLINTVFMAVMVAVGFTACVKSACNQCVNSRVRASACTGIELYSGILESYLCAAAYSTADKRIYLCNVKNACKRAASLAVCADYLGRYYFSVLDIIDLELLCSSEMSKYIAIIISYRYSHGVFSFFPDIQV